MSNSSHLEWPFFDAAHRDLAQRATEWAADKHGIEDESDLDGTCRRLVAELGKGG